ncbi:hypothetical protein [Nonomuraea sp. SYSU D8015]|nr:hypothetical protein [Nonomuraea sp. SYSU D8015]
MDSHVCVACGALDNVVEDFDSLRNRVVWVCASVTCYDRALRKGGL